jgi:hypothetical protein
MESISQLVKRSEDFAVGFCLMPEDRGQNFVRFQILKDLDIFIESLQAAAKYLGREPLKTREYVPVLDAQPAPLLSFQAKACYFTKDVTDMAFSKIRVLDQPLDITIQLRENDMADFVTGEAEPR